MCSISFSRVSTEGRSGESPSFTYTKDTREVRLAVTTSYVIYWEGGTFTSVGHPLLTEVISEVRCPQQKRPLLLAPDLFLCSQWMKHVEKGGFDDFQEMGVYFSSSLSTFTVENGV